MLRAACTGIDAQHDVLLTSPATTTARFVERCAVLFGLRVLRIEVADDDTFDGWGRRVQSIEPVQNAESLDAVFLSPCLNETDRAQDEATPADNAPIRDRAIVAISDQLKMFHLRRDGHLHCLIRRRLNDPAWPLATVYVALGSELVPARIAKELQDLGAVGWVVLNSSVDRPEESGAESSDIATNILHAEPAEAARIVPVPAAAEWQFLTHCTRRQAGPWPDQSEQDHLDDLILDRSGADHSSLAALCRIVKQQRLIATAQTVRGSTPVVSFTEVPVSELHRLRVFRPHRGRWDFEPYGICIRQDWLDRCNVRPVQYGDDELWQTLPPEDRPFFQLRNTRRSAGDDRIDWSVEQEWRHVGDVDLRELPSDAAMLFTPSESDARQIAQISRWPVAIVPKQA